MIQIKGLSRSEYSGGEDQNGEMSVAVPGNFEQANKTVFIHLRLKLNDNSD